MRKAAAEHKNWARDQTYEKHCK